MGNAANVCLTVDQVQTPGKRYQVSWVGSRGPMQRWVDLPANLSPGDKIYCDMEYGKGPDGKWWYRAIPTQPAQAATQQAALPQRGASSPRPSLPITDEITAAVEVARQVIARLPASEGFTVEASTINTILIRLFDSGAVERMAHFLRGKAQGAGQEAATRPGEEDVPF